MIENRNFLCQAFTIQVVNCILLITKQGPMGLNSYEYLSVFVFVDVCSHRAISTKINVLCYKGIEKCSLICTYDLCKQSCGQWSIPLCINGGHNASEKTLLSAKGGAQPTNFPLSELIPKRASSIFFYPRQLEFQSQFV